MSARIPPIVLSVIRMIPPSINDAPTIIITTKNNLSTLTEIEETRPRIRKAPLIIVKILPTIRAVRVILLTPI